MKVTVLLFWLQVLHFGSCVSAQTVESSLLSDYSSGKLKAVKDAVKQLPFERFQDLTANSIFRSLSSSLFTSKVEELTKAHGLSQQVKDSILDGMYAQVNKAQVQSFHFERGTGISSYAKFATLRKQDGTMDFSYMIASLNFSLKPTILVYKKTKKKWFKKRTKHYYESRPRSLSEQERQRITDYVYHEAHHSFNQYMLTEHAKNKPQRVEL